MFQADQRGWLTAWIVNDLVDNNARTDDIRSQCANLLAMVDRVVKASDRWRTLLDGNSSRARFRIESRPRICTRSTIDTFERGGWRLNAARTGLRAANYAYRLGERNIAKDLLVRTYEEALDMDALRIAQECEILARKARLTLA